MTHLWQAAFRSMVLLLLMGLTLPTNKAQASSDSAQLSISATVQQSCRLDSGVLNFGTYISGQTANLDALGQISFTTCSGQMSIELDGGLNPAGNMRQMTSGDHKLLYQIYRNSSRTSFWGIKPNNVSIVLVAPKSGKLDIYGRIPAGQIAPQGSYSDTVTVVLTF